MSTDGVEAKSQQLAKQLLEGLSDDQVWTHLAAIDKKSVDLAGRIERARGGSRKFVITNADLLDYHRRNTPIASAESELAELLLANIKLRMVVEDMGL